MMVKGLGCVAVILGLGLATTALVAASVPQLAGVLGLYSYVIVKGAADGIVGRPTFARLVALEPQAVNTSGDVGPAVVEYDEGGSTRRASVDLLPRPIRAYAIGDQIPVLVNRLDGTRAVYDAMWANRPEHQARLAPIKDMVFRRSREHR